MVADPRGSANPVERRFVAFVDILGFSEIVKTQAGKTPISLLAYGTCWRRLTSRPNDSKSIVSFATGLGVQEEFRLCRAPV